ncbi:MAG: STAS domain-containing protein [Chitinivibrionales bacterium]|nr:STAS domain-containing protein [Chitinivibrionales bacterium]
MALPRFKFGEKLYIGNADGLMSQVEPLFEEPAGRIVFDFENVRLCDSYGLRFLLNCRRKAEERGHRLILYKVHPVILELIENVKLDQFFTFTDTLDVN